MPLVAVQNRIYRANNSVVPVEWASYDFNEDVAQITNETIRSTLLEAGVMYVPSASPAIRVSHLLDPEMQGLSALHEELCMSRRAAACPTVEEMVIDSIESPELQTKFIETRLRMFGALCLMDSTNVQFEATRQVLVERACS